MAIKGLTEKQKKADKDLAAILLITLVFFLIYTFFGRELTDFALNDNAPAAFRTPVLPPRRTGRYPNGWKPSG